MDCGSSVRSEIVPQRPIPRNTLPLSIFAAAIQAFRASTGQIAAENSAWIVTVTHDEKIVDRFDRTFSLRDGRLEQ